MFKDMSKLEKAGLIIGGIQCVAGLGIAIYAKHKLTKQANNLEEAVNKDLEEINEILHQAAEKAIENVKPNIDDLMNKED